MKHAKMFAIIAVAAFCISAFAIAVNTDDSSADGEKLTYSFYLQLNNGTDTYSARLPDVEVAGTTPTDATYSAALDAVAEKAGITIDHTGSSLNGFVVDGKTYNNSPYGDWETDHYYYVAVFYVEDNAWKDVSDFTESTAIAITFDKYAFSQPAEADKYLYMDFGPGFQYWILKPSVELVNYKVYYELEDKDGHKFSKWTESQQFGISAESLRSARVLGAKAAGFTVVNTGIRREADRLSAEEDKTRRREIVVDALRKQIASFERTKENRNNTLDQLRKQIEEKKALVEKLEEDNRDSDLLIKAYSDFVEQELKQQ